MATTHSATPAPLSESTSARHTVDWAAPAWNCTSSATIVTSTTNEAARIATNSAAILRLVIRATEC